MLRNYFADLGLNPDAELHEVRHAYKKLALRYHPDHHPNNPEAQEKFIQITEAYKNLSSSDQIRQIRMLIHIHEPVNAEQNPRPRAYPNERWKACPDCHGKGVSRIERGAFRWNKTCMKCLGKGHILEK